MIPAIEVRTLDELIRLYSHVSAGPVHKLTAVKDICKVAIDNIQRFLW